MCAQALKRLFLPDSCFLRVNKPFTTLRTASVMLTYQQTVSNTPGDRFSSLSHTKTAEWVKQHPFSVLPPLTGGREKDWPQISLFLLPIFHSYSSTRFRNTITHLWIPNNAFVLHFVPLLCIPSSRSPCIPCFGAPCDIPAMWEQEPRVEWREDGKTDRFFVPTWPGWMSALLPLGVCMCVSVTVHGFGLMMSGSF